MSDQTVGRAGGSDAIFISYRRGDTAYPAGWLYHQLVDHFGANQVFKDVDSIELGSDFVAEITTAVAKCHCLLALIGRDWLTAADGRGRRRLDDPADFVRLEIEAALARNVRVIPVLVEDAVMPYADELPPSLAPITRRQALVLSPTRFTADIAKLINVLERTFAEAAAARAAEQASQEAAERERSEAEAAAAREAERATREAAERERLAAAAVAARETEQATREAAERERLAAAAVAARETEQATREAAERKQIAAAVAARETEQATREAAERERIEADAAAQAEPITDGRSAEVRASAPVDMPVSGEPTEPADPAPKGSAPASETKEQPSSRSAWLGRGILAAPVLFLLTLFLPWTTDQILTRDGFSSPLLLVALILLMAATWMLLPVLGASFRPSMSPATATFGLTGVALVCTVLAFVEAGATGPLNAVGFGIPAGSDRTALAGAYMGLGVALVAAVLGALLWLARWKSSKEAPPPIRSETQSRYGLVLVAILPVALLGVIAHPSSAADTPAPYAGERAWWSFYGNDHDSTLELTNPLILNGADTAELTAQVNYEAEEGYDFLYGEVSIDDGATWTRLDGTVNGESTWSVGETEEEGFSGKSGDAEEDGETDWVPLKYDLSPWEGESEVLFRFRYVTDSSAVSKGFFLDEVKILGDVTEIIADGAETDDNGPWTPKGFVKVP